MANRITAQGQEAELDSRSGRWTSIDAVLEADLNRLCGIEIVGGESPDPVETQLDCAVEVFDAVVLERDAPTPGVKGRVY